MHHKTKTYSITILCNTIANTRTDLCSLQYYCSITNNVIIIIVLPAQGNLNIEMFYTITKTSQFYDMANFG